MDTLETKSKRKMTPRQLADGLRGLADVFDGKAATVPDGWPEDFRTVKKLSLKIKTRDGDSLSVRLKTARIAGTKDADRPQTRKGKPRRDSNGGKPHSYTDLKKQMKKTFNAIGASLAKDAAPTDSLLSKFLKDSESMTMYPDKGAEFYGEFRKSCDRLGRMLRSGNLDAARSAYEELHRLKNQCHKRYK